MDFARAHFEDLGSVGIHHNGNGTPVLVRELDQLAQRGLGRDAQLIIKGNGGSENGEGIDARAGKYGNTIDPFVVCSVDNPVDVPLNLL
jgi:hypothetical protein